MTRRRYPFLKGIRRPIRSHTTSFGTHVLQQNVSGWTINYDHNGRESSRVPYSSRATARGSQRFFPTKNWKTNVAGVPDFRPPAHYYRCTWEESFPPGRVSYRRADGSLAQVIEGQCPYDIGYLGPHIGGLGTSLLIDQNLINQCETEAMNKLPDMKVSLGQNLAESRETIHQVVHTCGRVLRAFHALHRRDFRGMANELGVSFKRLRNGSSLSDWWLEYHFGWQPLLADIHGGIAQAQEGFRHKAQVFSVSRTVTRSSSGPGSIPGPLAWSEIKVQGNSFQSTRVKLYARISNETLANASSIGILNPLQIAWELVPYSFVVDWFMPVGSFLETLTDTAGLTFVSGVRTDRVVSQFNSTYTPPSYGYPNWDGSFSCSNRVRGVNRVPYGGWPAPLPYVKNPLSTSHVASGLALIQQLVANRWRR